jgi:hypothetical protein
MQFAWLEPEQGCVFMEDNFAFFNDADEGMEGYCECRILMRAGRKAATNAGLNPDFLLQFAAQAFFGCFTGINLAAGEFPLVGHAHSGAALGREYTPLTLDYGACNVNMFFRGWGIVVHMLSFKDIDRAAPSLGKDWLEPLLCQRKISPKYLELSRIIGCKTIEWCLLQLKWVFDAVIRVLARVGYYRAFPLQKGCCD